MKKIYLFLTAMVLVLTACEKDQIGRYDLGSYVYFTQKETASQSFSFSYYPGLTTHSLEFEVNLMGDLLTEDKTFELYISCFRAGGVENAGVVYGLGANAPGDVKNTEAMTAAYELGKTV